MEKQIPISDAKKLGKERGYQQIIIAGWDGETNVTTITTWGDSKTDCEQAAQGGNLIKAVLGWPDGMCNDQPDHVVATGLKTNPFQHWLRSQGYTRKGGDKGAWMKDGNMLSGKDLVDKLDEWKKEEANRPDALLCAVVDLFQAPHQEHFATRLNHEEYEALQQIRKIVEARIGKDVYS